MLSPVSKPSPIDLVSTMRIGDSFGVRMHCCGKQKTFTMEHGERFAVESATIWADGHKCK